MLIRYADNFLVAFHNQREARDVYDALAPRVKKFMLDVAPEKTTLKRFSRFHPGQQRHFEFLGFRFYWDTGFKAEPPLRRKAAPKKQKSTLQSFYQWIKDNHHRRINHWMLDLKRKMVGFRSYFGFPVNSLSVARIYDHILRSLYIWLTRRSGQKVIRGQG